MPTKNSTNGSTVTSRISLDDDFEVELDDVAAEPKSKPETKRATKADEAVASPGWRARIAGWSERGVRVPLLGVAAAVLVGVVLVSVLGYLYWSASDRNNDLEGTVAASRQTEQDRSAALTAATNFMTTANNIDYQNLDPWFKQMTDGSTGAFRDSYEPVKSGIGEVIKASQLKITGKVNQAAISTQTDNSIRVLALVDQTIQSVKLTQPTQVATAMYVDLMKVNGEWKVYGMNQGADQSLSAATPAAPGLPVPAAPGN
jgi:hypothetical protein